MSVQHPISNDNLSNWRRNFSEIEEAAVVVRAHLEIQAFGFVRAGQRSLHGMQFKSNDRASP